MKRISQVLLLYLAIIAGAGGAKAEPAPDNAVLLQQANELFRQGNEHKDRGQDGEGFYRQALLRYEQLVNERGIRSGRLYYNIGNTYYMLGDLGRAILYYLRAERLMPADPNLTENLEYVRGKRRDRIESADYSKMRRLFTLKLVPLPVREQLAALAFGLFWLLLSLRLFRPRLAPRFAAAACAVLALVLGLSVFRESRAPEGVITAEEITARKGDGLSYSSSFAAPLHAGTEFVLIERRAGWWLVELKDGSRCWLPAEAAELV